MFFHSSSGASQVGLFPLKIPAFALTMSRRPSSATPSSSAAFNAPTSRTSACRATIRRSRDSTSLTVCSRSPASDIG